MCIEPLAGLVACTLNALDFQSINLLEGQFHAASLVESSDMSAQAMTAVFEGSG